MKACIHQSTGARMWKSNFWVHNFKILQSARIAFLRLKNAIRLYLKLCTQKLDFHISAPVDCHCDDCEEPKSKA